MKKNPVSIAIIHCGFIYSGGGERIVLEQAKGLRDKGYKVSIFAPTYSPKKCFPDIIADYDVQTFLPQLPEWIVGKYAISMILSSLFAPLFALRFRSTDIFMGANQPGAWIAFCLSKILNRPYIVYMNQPNRLLYPREIDRQVGWVTTVHDYHLLFSLIQVLRPIIKFADMISYAGAQARLVNGAYIKGIIESLYGFYTHSLPAASYIHSKDEWKGRDDRGSITVRNKQITKPYALITNRHDPQKKFDYCLAAMQQVIKKVPQAKLVIPGPFTKETTLLKQLAKRLKVDKNVVFLGEVTQKELQELYKHAAIYCYPSPNEDFGLGPLEAAAWAVPTVAWNFAGPTITVVDKKTGFLVKPYDVAEYAEKMILLFSQPLLRRKLGLAAWERVKEQFSWEGHITNLERRILNILR